MQYAMQVIRQQVVGEKTEVQRRVACTNFLSPR